MNFDWFKDLAHLAQTGNFSQAAELSHISQPAFSRRIKALETWVGSNLVDRSRQPVILTSSGSQILEAGQQALARLEQERAQIREAATSPENYIITFGAQHSIGWRFFPAWLQAFEEGFGPIISRLRADDLPSCVNAMRSQEVDFVIAYQSKYAAGVAGFRTLESINIGWDTLIPVCKADRNGNPVFPLINPNAPKVPWLRFGEAAPITQHLEPILEITGIRDRLGMVYENTMAGALRIRARNGDGVAWLPKSLIAPDLDSGQLAITGPQELQVPLDIKLFRLNDHTNTLTQKIWTYLLAREKNPLIATI